MVHVIKASGEKEEFDKNKIRQTCFRAGVSQKNCERIANEVEKEVYEGISTQKILKIVLKKLGKTERKETVIKYGMRDSLSKLGGLEFEKYAEHLLRVQGYRTSWNLLLKGELVTHQIDVIAEKNSERIMIECKHHSNPHRFTGLQEALALWAAYDDLKKGGENLSSAWLISSTKLSDHAIQYGIGKNMGLTSWNYPENDDLREWITGKGFYPLTSLDLSPPVRHKLMDADVLLVHELAQANANELARKAKMPSKTIGQLAGRAQLLLNTK